MPTTPAAPTDKADSPAPGSARVHVPVQIQPAPRTRTPEDGGADFVDHVFAYLLAEFPQIAGPRFANAKRAVREELAGERVYVATRGSAERQALAHEVLALFNGRNATEVARRLNISRATVYRLLKQPRRDGGSGGAG